MRVEKLDIGLEAISRWREVDEVHLPTTGRLGTAFLPTQGLLDEILRRPTLDERLIGLLQPKRLDMDLLDAPVLAATRLQVLEHFEALTSALANPEIAEGADVLADDEELDGIVRSALAALLRG